MLKLNVKTPSHIFFFFILCPATSFSELRIDITRGNTEPIPVALVQLETKNDTEEKFHLISVK